MKSFCIALTVLALAMPAQAAEPAWRDAYTTALEMIQASAASQRRISAMSKERDTLQADSVDVRLSQDFANRRVRELETEQFRRAAEIVDLEERLRAGELTRLELVPLLDDMLQALSEFVSSDLPFDIEHRRARIRNAHKLLTSHAAPLEQKLLNVYELYRAEIDAGLRIDIATGQRIHVDDSERAVDLLRAGRVALYAMTPDRQWAGTWNHETGRWQTVPSRYRDAIADAFLMTASGHYTKPIALPLETQ